MSNKWLASSCPRDSGLSRRQARRGRRCSPPTVEFDPANSIVPFPNNLLLDPTTGKVNLPEQCNETARSHGDARARAQHARRLRHVRDDDHGDVHRAVDVTSLTAASCCTKRATRRRRPPIRRPRSRSRSWRFPARRSGSRTTRTSRPAPIRTMVDQVTFVPTLPLEPEVDVHGRAARRDQDGERRAAFNASFTWSLIRDPEPVVELDDAGNVIVESHAARSARARRQGAAAGHRPAVEGAPRRDRVPRATPATPSSELLLAFEFNTQTTTDPLDRERSRARRRPRPRRCRCSATRRPRRRSPAVDAGLFAQCVADDPISDTECFLRVLLGGGNYAVGKATCAAAGCAAINDVLGSLAAVEAVPGRRAEHAYTGTGTMPIPGAWSNPLHADGGPRREPGQSARERCAGQARRDRVDPADARRRPRGYPTVIFQHGITRARTDVLGVAGGLTVAGLRGRRDRRRRSRQPRGADLECRARCAATSPSAFPGRAPISARIRRRIPSATRRCCRRISARRATASARPSSTSSSS